MKKLYLDYSATTPIKKEVLEYVNVFLNENFGNPSSVHSFGLKNKEALAKARASFAECINAKPSEIYFTSGGTESDNWALKGIAEAHKDKGKHIIVSSIEHPAILNTAKRLEKNGYDISYLGVDEFGRISLEELENSIRNDTILVSIMYVNNEIGTVQDIKGIGKICRKHGILFHTDAVQAFSNLRIDVEDLNVDLMSISAHKFYAFKGTGALYLRDGIQIAKLLDGGSQEKSKRSGTENITGIVAMAKAAEMAIENLDEHVRHLTTLREYTLKRVMNEIDGVKYNGHKEFRHPANLHFSFKGCNSTALLIALDSFGIAVSAGSACSSGSIKASHVLSAIGLDEDLALASIRISFGDYTSLEDCDYLVESLKKIINNMSKR